MSASLNFKAIADQEMAAASHPEPALRAPVNELVSAERPAKSPGRLVPRLRSLWDKRRFLGHATLTGLLVGVLVAYLIPDRFDSQTQLMPPDTQSASGIAMAALAATGSNALLAGNLLGVKSSGALFMGILQSRTVEDRIVDHFNLRQVYGSQRQDAARRKLEECTSISEDHKSGIISITISDRDPQRAAAMAQAYVEELDRRVADVSTSAARRERIFLEERLHAVKQELDQASRDFSQFQSTSATLDIKEQGRAMFDAAATLAGQLVAAESELKGLEAIYTTNNVRVQAIQARIAELRRQLIKMGSSEGIVETKAANHSAYASAYPSIRKLPLLGATYTDLYRQTKIKEAVYETLTQQYELAKVQEAKETPTVKVLDVAKIPETKSYPPRLPIILLCTALSLMGATTLVLGEAKWKDIDKASPGKMLAREVRQTLHSQLPRPTNGSRLHAITHRIWSRFSGNGRLSTDRDENANLS